MVSENNMFQSCLHKVLYLSVIQWYTCFLTVFSNDASNRYLTYVCHRFAEFFGLVFASSLRNGMYRKTLLFCTSDISNLKSAFCMPKHFSIVSGVSMYRQPSHRSECV